MIQSIIFWIVFGVGIVALVTSLLNILDDFVEKEEKRREARIDALILTRKEG